MASAMVPATSAFNGADNGAFNGADNGAFNGACNQEVAPENGAFNGTAMVPATSADNGACNGAFNGACNQEVAPENGAFNGTAMVPATSADNDTRKRPAMAPESGQQLRLKTTSNGAFKWCLKMASKGA